MLGAAFPQGLVEFVEQLALVVVELDRRFDRHMAVQVAGVTRAHALDPLAAQAELFAGLGAFGNVDRSLALQRRHFDFAAQGRPRETDRHHAMQVVAVTLEDLVLPQANLDVQVARRPAIGARLAVAGAADAHGVVDARRDLHLQRLLLLDPALPVAGGARFGDDLAGAAAMGAGLLHAEETLAHLHHALAMAGGAGLGLRAGFGAVAVAGVALFPGRNADLGLLAERRFLQRDFHCVRQVAATVDLAPGAAAAALLAEDVAEDVAEGFREAAEAFGAACGTTHVGVHSG